MSITLRLNGASVVVRDPEPTTTTLEWLRAAGHTGTKEGCAEGDCGACTVAVRSPTGEPGTDGDASAWRAVCACILPVAQLADHDVVTVEGLARPGALHPAQQAMVETLGSQCGYCTPGFVMSLFEATYRPDLQGGGARARRDDQICGNLCRCTGYRPIRDALDAVAGTCPADGFQAACAEPPPPLGPVDLLHGRHRFVRPTSWDSLFSTLSASPTDPVYVQGATDLGLNITQRGEKWPLLVDLSALPELDALEETPDGWTIGAGVRLSTLEAWSAGRIPVLARMLRFFASRQIKNRATLGGNLCNASPIGDLPPVMLALDATLHLRGPQGDRTVSIDDFFLAYRSTALQPGEVLRAVSIPRPPVGALQSALKVSKRRELDISTVCAALVVATDDTGTVLHARLAYGGLAATPKRALHTEAALRNTPWSAESIEQAVRSLPHDFTPIDDHRGSAWYRSKVAANLLRAFHAETLDRPTPVLPDRPVGTAVLDAPAAPGADQ